MRRLLSLSLAWKLSLAFVVVAVVGVGIVALLVGRVTQSEFGSYLEHTQRMRGMIGPAMRGMMAQMMGTAEQQYLQAVNNALWLAGAGAVAVAIVVGLFLAHQIAAPLHALTAAAKRIARGDLSQRVALEGRDEIGELAAAFNTMAEALGRNEELKRHLVADVAHELRTPLTVLQGKVEAMLDGVVKPTPPQLAALHEEILLLSRLVADLRTLSLADAGQLELHRSPTDLGALIRGAAAAAEPQAQAKNIALSLELAPGLPPAAVDPDRIGQVLRNILSNALRYTPEGGSIRIAAATSPGHDGASQITVSLSDTGAGIPPEELSRVFDRFYRADPSRARGTGGSGIGLAIVKQLVEAHGGTVWAESVLGRGSTFHFRIPASSLTAEPRAARPTSERAPAKGR